MRERLLKNDRAHNTCQYFNTTPHYRTAGQRYSTMVLQSFINTSIWYQNIGEWPKRVQHIRKVCMARRGSQQVNKGSFPQAATLRTTPSRHEFEQNQPQHQSTACPIPRKRHCCNAIRLHFSSRWPGDLPHPLLCAWHLGGEAVWDSKKAGVD